MKYLAFASLTLSLLVTALILFVLAAVNDANAVVCARACTERGAPVHTAPSSRAAHITALICERRGTNRPLEWVNSGPHRSAGRMGDCHDCAERSCTHRRPARVHHFAGYGSSSRFKRFRRSTNYARHCC
jgi:hypothetical protein